MHVTQIVSVLMLVGPSAVGVPVDVSFTASIDVLVAALQPKELEQQSFNTTGVATADQVEYVDFMTCPQPDYQPTNAAEKCAVQKMKNYGCEFVAWNGHLPRFIKSVMPWPGIVCWLYHNQSCDDFDNSGVLEVPDTGNPHLKDSGDGLYWANQVMSIKCNHV